MGVEGDTEREGAESSEKRKRRRQAAKPKAPITMCEAMFKKIRWTRSFISGPPDPIASPHTVWCHICKKTLSVASRGSREIVRHHKGILHLRSYQRWAYEHSKVVDSVTGETTRTVRGRDGRVLTKRELAKELPNFIHKELVEIGEHYPFCEDLNRLGAMSQSRNPPHLSIQLSLVGDFVTKYGNLAVLQSIWTKAGVFTNYASSFRDFDWNKEHLTVSIFSFRIDCSLIIYICNEVFV